MSEQLQNNANNIETQFFDINPIYKVNYLVNGLIDTIYVFIGKKIPTEIEESQLFSKIFTEEENENITTNKIEVVFSEQQIHPDDSIGVIKLKILSQLKDKASLDEIYLFCQKIETLHSVAIYQSLTQNKRIALTRTRLEQFISNIVSDRKNRKFKKPVSKETYDYDDILEMNIDNKSYLVNKPLGMKYFIVENEYPFVANPFEVTEYDSFFEKSSRKTLTTLNSNLLLNTGDIFNNNIFLCLAKDVIEHLTEKPAAESTTIKIYYPFLYNKNINSLEVLDDSKQQLLETTKQLLTDKTLDLFKTVDMFYDVYKLRKNNLQYISRGIKFIKVVVRPLFAIKLPLEVIFKITHATDTTPLIKYNPSTRQENVFRLYTADAVSTDGRKIPVLKKGTIFKLMKSIGKNKSVSIFIEITVEDNLVSIICEIDENGYITITSEFNTLVDEKMIDNLFKEAVNPNIQEIKNYLEQSGYKINLFNSVNDENVEVKQLTYEMKIQISKPVNLESFKGCVSSVFNNESSEFKSGIHLRFKRVANFNKVTSQEAFIIEKRDQGYSAVDIIEALLQNYSDDLTRKQAEELVMKVANEVRVERGVRKSEIKIKDNPGFKTTILLEKQTGIISIVTDNINDMNYLTTIPIYLDTIIRLTQNKNSTNYPLPEINKLCSSGEKEDVELPDIISPAESKMSEFEEPILDENEELTHKKSSNNSESDLEDNKTKNALSLFFGDDDDEEDEDEDEEEQIEKGGAPVGSSGSEESIPSIPAASSSSASYKPLQNLPALSSSAESNSASEKSKSASEKSKSVSEESNSASEKSISSIPAASSSASDKPLQNLPALSSSAESKSVSEESKSVSEESKSVSEESTPASDKPLQNLPSLSPTIAASSNGQPNVAEDSSSSEVVVKKKPQPKPQEPSAKNITPKRKPVVESDSEPEPEESSSSEVVVKKKPQPKPQEPSAKNITPKRKPVVESDSESDDEDKDEANMRLSVEDEDQPAFKKDIDNMSLRNYFQDKIEELDAPLIVKQKIGNYSIYSKVCQSHQKRQPIILTDNELAKLKKDKNIKNFLRPEDVVKYGSDKNKQFNYICPRYWCLKTNKPLDPKEFKEKIENGKKVLFHPTCGKILPEGEDEVKPGHYVYEFYKPKKSNPNYKRYPGFQVDKHPKGFCLPCCFDKYLTDGRIKANQKCLENPVPEKTSNDAKEEKEQDDYIKGPDKFPLNQGRWGYLPVAIQTMLHEVNADCQISKTNTNIKQNHPCLLRHGVEVSDKQSFISCISDAIFFTQNILDKTGNPTGQKAKVLSIREMKERIIKILTIDNFIKYQNGNLVTDFYDPNKEVDTSKYKENNDLVKKINLANEPDKLFFEKVVSAFETFIEFLKDDTVIIDHTYLWDLVCKPNKYLFGATGINLVIFEIPKDDITNNLRLICPSNHYSSEFYEARKPTLILMKEDNYYEPIYQYKINNNKITIAKIFSEAESNLSSTMRAVFKEIIKPFYDNNCKPLPSMPIEYLAKTPIALYTLIQKLDKYEYTILKLVINFNAKVIGVLAKSPANIKGFIPCYPTALSENLKQNLDYVLMTDSTIWNTYDNTVEFLTTLEKRSAKKRPEADIPCKPVFKIVEDEMVVGILTETNQFIQLSAPVVEKDIRSTKPLISIKDKNYIVSKNSVPMIQSDVIITTSKKVDDERVDYIKRIKLETNFYNVFRNTIKILLNDYQHAKLREQIESELTKNYVIYHQKLKNVNKLLRELAKDSVRFIGDDNYYKLINEVSTCLVKDGNTCKDTPNLCAVSEGGKCRLILPEKNLITHKQNEEIYYGKIADEIIRFSRIKSFMFKPQSYLSFGNIGYNLRDNEIIMVQSLLTQEYFENLTPAPINKYVHFNSYDEALPIITQPYDNVIPSLNHAIGKNAERTCQKSEKGHITSTFWKRGFPESFKEVVYGKSSYCTFIVMCDLIEKKTGNKLTVNQLKNILFEEYKKYLDRFHQQIIDILIFEGKKTLGDQVKAETLSFSSFIYTDSYFITPFDMWLLVQKYKIPTIFISQTPIKILTSGKHRSFLAYGNAEKNENFVFIVVPGLRPQNVPNFKLIESNKQDVFISLDHVKGECLENINSALDNEVSIEDFLSSFKRPVAAQQINRPDSDSDDEVVVIKKPVKKIVRKIVVEESPLIEELEPEAEPKLVTVKKTKKRNYVNKRGTKKILHVPVTNKKIVVESDSSD